MDTQENSERDSVDKHYYETETISLTVEYEIRYKRGSKECRDVAIRVAEKELPSGLLGCGKHGCYGVTRKTISLDNGKDDTSK